MPGKRNQWAQIKQVNLPLGSTVDLIKFSVGDRFVLVVQTVGNQPEDAYEHLRRASEGIDSNLNEWAKGEDPFFVLTCGGGVKVIFEKVAEKEG